MRTRRPHTHPLTLKPKRYGISTEHPSVTTWPPYVTTAGNVWGSLMLPNAQPKPRSIADRLCARCGAQILQRPLERPSAFRLRRYCSNRCSSVTNLAAFTVSYKREVACPQCGTVTIKKRSAGDYCSARCFYEWKRAHRKPCPVCGKVPSDSRYINSRQTCSAACGYTWRKSKTRAQKSCKHCETLFWPSLRRGGKYCSRRCSLADKSKRLALIEAICAHCGLKFRRTRAAIKRQKRSYCSPTCAREHNRGENNVLYRGENDPNRGGDWRRLAESIRERDGYRCQRCNRTQEDNKQKLSVDHIVPWRSFSDKKAANDPCNLVSLCRRCHSIKTTVYERLWLKGDRIGMDQYRRAIQLPPLFAAVNK